MPLFAIILLSGFASAYGYYDDYKKEYTVKETWNQDGYSYYEKNTNKNPWGEKTVYTKIEDYDNYRGYSSRSSNPASNYWNDGPNKGYSKTYRVTERGDDWRYLGYAWDDSYRRDMYDTQYHDYYYMPKYYYNGEYYNWEGKEPRCRTGWRCDGMSYCGGDRRYCR